MAKWKSGARGGRPDRGGGGFTRGGRGRGSNGGGRGGDWASQAPGRGRGYSHSGSNSSIQDELDFTLQTYANAPSPLKPMPAEPSASARGRGFTAFRGRGRGGPLIPMQLSANTTFPGRGRGFDIPRRQVQGIGAPKDARRIPVPVGARQTLSNLLSQERPLLKPIVFVPSTETRFLFQNEEELLQPIVEDVDHAAQSPIPTADRVTRVFSGRNIPPDIWDNDEDGPKDDIEVVDFNDLGKLFGPMASTPTTATLKRENNLVPVDNTTIHEECIRRNRNQETRLLPTEMVEKPLSAPNRIGINGNQLFYVDTQPSNVPNGMEFPSIQHRTSVLPDNDDDDIIVYVAPHPRNTSGQQKELSEDVTEVSTSNDHGRVGVDTQGFSSYERHAALPTLESHTQPESTISTASLSSAVPTILTTPHIPEPLSSSVTFSNSTLTPDTGTTNATTAIDTTSTPTRLRVPPITTLRQAKLWKSKLSRANKGTKSLQKTPFSAFGTMREENLLRKLDGERDKRYNERRRGDSDLEWGDTTDDGGEGVAGVGKEVLDMNAQEQEQKPELDADMKRVLGMLEKGKERMGENLKQAEIDYDHGMEVDVDVDIETIERFVKRLTGADAGYVTIDDIEREEIMRMEDEGDEDANQTGSSSDEDDEEEEEALRVEEAKFIADGDLGNPDGSDDEETDELGEDDSDDEEGENDEDESEDSSFHVKLNRLRSMGVPVSGDFDAEDSDDPLQRNMTLADQDEAFIGYLDVLLDNKETKARKHRTKLSPSPDDDDYEYVNWSSSPAGRRGNYKNLPRELSIQFELDRKKAEWKRERELKRLARAADPLSKKKSGKKGRKAAAAADPTITVLPNRVIDMTTLVQNIRRFIADVGGPSSMSLPPADKETRKNVHEIAAAFNLRSDSKGKGDTRYTTLIKTTKTGIQVNDGKIAAIVRRSMARGGMFLLEDKKGKGVVRVPRHREGDVVGKTAPKLDDSNVGFRLLEMMGWSEGDRIGASTNGLEVPLAAVIKTSKLGLGARK